MKTTTSLVTILVCVIFFSVSCKKEPGEGGGATIKGKLFAKNFYSPNRAITADDYEPGEDVFIIYGDETVYHDDYETSYDGSFEFKYLRKGTYTIFAYSLDSTQGSPEGIVPITKTIEITGRKEIINLNELVILKEADKGGTSTIRGKVFTKDYNGNFTILNSQYYTPDEYVYIIYGNSTHYNDRTKTKIDGSFEFNNLRKGNYQVFTYSDDSTQNSPSTLVSVMANTEITEKNQVMEIPDLVIFK